MQVRVDGLQHLTLITIVIEIENPMKAFMFSKSWDFHEIEIEILVSRWHSVVKIGNINIETLNACLSTINKPTQGNNDINDIDMCPYMNWYNKSWVILIFPVIDMWKSISNL